MRRAARRAGGLGSTQGGKQSWGALEETWWLLMRPAGKWGGSGFTEGQGTLGSTKS